MFSHETGKSAFVRYLFGVEFAVFSLVLSHGRTYPESWIEQLFSLVIMMLMGTLYAFALGQATSLVTSMDPAGTDYNKHKELMKLFVSETRFPPELRGHLLEYFDDCRNVLRRRHYSRLFSLLSPSLRGRVAEHMYGTWMRRVPFFACKDLTERRAFTRAVSEKLAPAVFGKAETIAHIGQPSLSLMIVVKGVVGQSTGLVLTAGRYFGEEFLLRDGRFTRNFISVTFVSVEVLSGADLFAVLSNGDFPQIARGIRQWTVRQSFARAIRALVRKRRAKVGYIPMTKVQIKREREALLRIARGGKLGGRKAGARPTSYSRAAPGVAMADISEVIDELHRPPMSREVQQMSYIGGGDIVSRVELATRVSNVEKLLTSDIAPALAKMNESIEALSQRIDSGHLQPAGATGRPAAIDENATRDDRPL